MDRLTHNERLLVQQASARAGWTESQLLGLVAAVERGDREYSLETNGISGRYDNVRAALPRGPVSGPNLVLSYDLTDAATHSAGYDDEQEKNLLRIRLTDVAAEFGRAAVLQRLPLMVSLKPVLQVSLFAASIAFRGDLTWLDDIIAAGWTSSGNDGYIKLAKEANILAKAFQIDGWDNRELMELHALTGYSFARDEAAQQALNDEAVAMTESTAPYVPAYKNCYFIEEEMEDYGYARLSRSLPEYIASLEWLAPGGAALTGVPKMEVLVDGAIVKLRVTKNRLPFLTTPDYIEGLVAGSMGQFFAEPKIKSEQQKFRWIYNVNTAANLLLSYLCDGIVQPNYRGTTLGEDFHTLVGRLWTSVHEVFPNASSLLRVHLKEYMEWLLAKGLPILPPTPEGQVVWMGDYVTMDKQIRNWQQALWLRRVAKGVGAPAWLGNVCIDMASNSYMLDPRLSPQAQAAAKKVILSRTAKADRRKLTGMGDLSLPPTPPPGYLYMKGSLASGSRITTYINTTVNIVNLRICSKIVNKIRPNATSNLEARGDDSKVTCESQAVALLFHLLISACGAMSADKSRAGTNSEFLRLQFVPDGTTPARYAAPSWGVSGILARSVGTLVQRKPISTERASMHLNKMVELLGQLPTCLRRGASPKLSSWCWRIATRVAVDSGIEPGWYNALQAHGGAGLGDPNNRSYHVSAKPKATARAGTWAAQRNLEQYAEFGVSTEEAQTIANWDMAAIALESDEPEVKAAWKDNKPTFKTKADEPNIKFKNVSFSRAMDVTSRAMFAKGRQLAARFTKAAVVARVRGGRALDYISPSDAEVIRRTERRLKCSRRGAVDWLDGKVGYNLSTTSPELARILAVRTAAQYLSVVKVAQTAAYTMACCAAYEARRVHSAWRFLFSW